LGPRGARFACAALAGAGSFGALEFEGFEVLRRELLTEHAAQGLHPQLLVLLRRESPRSLG
jgi:hypothetical protein